MDGTSYAIWAILALVIVSLVWTLILVKISSDRLESRIINLKVELAEWLIEEVQQLDVSGEPPTPFSMLMPFIQDWLSDITNPTMEAKVIPARGEGGKFK
jgi:hypothetical protein